MLLAALAAASVPLLSRDEAVAGLPQDAPAVSALVDAAAAYVRRYQRELTSVVADETYTQHVVTPMPREQLRPSNIRLTSEIFFMFLAGHDWMAIRDVLAVDGAPLAGRPDLRQALQQLPAPEVAARFKAYNSRFNIGRVSRNFNEPTLSLLPLDDRHRARFSFEPAPVTRVGAGGPVTLAFDERRGPTLVHTLDGVSAFAGGEVTIEPATGRVTNAVLALTMGSVRATLSTRYAFDERLRMMVPVRFSERYVDRVARPATKGHARTRDEEIRCDAVYTNFRRFEVTSRIR